VFYNSLGRQQREPTLLDDLQSEAVAHELDAEPPAWDLSSLDWEYVDDRLKRAVDELPTTYRAILLLWAVEGLKYREIADVIDIPLGTVMSRLYRARMTLSAALADLAKEKGIEL
jgi:RNA polymerase sigma-70 factor, ECF subfamily